MVTAQESIAFPYEDGGSEWIDESARCTSFWGNSTSLARSHRISSARLRSESGWVPGVRALDVWDDVS